MWHSAGSCAAGSRRSYNDRRMASPFAITDNGSGRAGCGPRGLRAARLGSLVLYPHPVLGLLAGKLKPVEHLCGRVDLVVVLAFGKGCQLVKVFGKPPRLLRRMHKAVLDHRGLGAHADDLVRLRLVAGDGVQPLLDQFLDQLPEALSSIKYDISRKCRALLAHRALQFGIFHAPAFRQDNDHHCARSDFQLQDAQGVTEIDRGMLLPGKAKDDSHLGTRAAKGVGARRPASVRLEVMLMMTRTPW